MRKTSTFREQLEQLSDANFARVTARAQLANQVAKENLSGEAAWESLRKRRETPAGAE